MWFSSIIGHTLVGRIVLGIAIAAILVYRISLQRYDGVVPVLYLVMAFCAFAMITGNCGKSPFRLYSTGSVTTHQSQESHNQEEGTAAPKYDLQTPEGILSYKIHTLKSLMEHYVEVEDYLEADRLKKGIDNLETLVHKKSAAIASQEFNIAAETKQMISNASVF